MAYLLSFAFNMHDSSVVISNEKEVMLLLEGERFFHSKKIGCSAEQMEQLILAALNYCKLDPEDVSVWISTGFQNKFLKREHFTDHIEKRSVKFLGKKRELWLVNHHLAHAGSSLAFDIRNALIYVSDGGGDFRIKNMGYRLKNRLIEEPILISPQAMTGTFYQHCSRFIYGTYNCEGSFMALSAYGEPVAYQVKKLNSMIEALSNSKTPDAVSFLHKHFGNLSLKGKQEFYKAADFAASVQYVFIHTRKQDISEFINSQQPSESGNIVLAGGTCLNISCNRELHCQWPGKKIRIAPCCDDTGQALGALLVYSSELAFYPKVSFPFLGRGYDREFSTASLKQVVDELVQGKIVIFHYGREEVGPRALGHRSLFCRPDDLETSKKLSVTVKGRAWYRPLAPMVLSSYSPLWFDGPLESPYMLNRGLAHKVALSDAPAVIHCDRSSRFQTIESNDNDIRYRLLSMFKEATGLPLLVNTSLNGPGEPICSTEEDTLRFYKLNKSKGLSLFLNDVVFK